MDLPLFPLNSVLFPNMPLQLHIFEERYIKMINECIDEQKPFGVVLIQSGREAFGPTATPHEIGTTAHITEVTKLPFGRMNILAIGRDRFRVNNLDSTSQPYLMGDVELMPLSERNQQMIKTGGTKLRPLVKRYLDGLKQAQKFQFDTNQIPSDPMPLAYLAAVLLQNENDQKQALLEADSTRSFLLDLIKAYQKEVTLMDILLTPPKAEQDNPTPFSLS